MRFSLPDHIRWPLLVVLLLVGGVTSTVGMVFATRSDGGVEPIADYYAESLRWNEYAAERDASARLGYRAALRVEPTDVDGLARVVLLVTDSLGLPVEGLQGTVRARRPHLSAPVAEVPFGTTPAPGRYEQMLPVTATGLWDFDVRARQGETPVLFTLRIEQ